MDARTAAAVHVTAALVICEQASRDELDLPLTLLRDVPICLGNDLDYLS
ncbi:MAG: hypothetical protein ACRDYA_04435 [Egibacteraceae bacterium]